MEAYVELFSFDWPVIANQALAHDFENFKIQSIQCLNDGKTVHSHTMKQFQALWEVLLFRYGEIIEHLPSTLHDHPMHTLISF